jgi:hypothetical protein
MKRKNRFVGLMLITAIVFLMPSCNKDESGTIPKDDVALAQDEAYADAVFEETDDMALSEVKNLDDDDYGSNVLKSAQTNVCYTVSVSNQDTTTFPKTITIDFDEGCTTIFNGDTITRSGQIVITITNRWFVVGAQHIITFNNFYFNGAKVEGTRTLTNDGLNNQNHLESSVTLENGKITFADDTYISRNSSHVREWIWHANSLNDTVCVTGYASGVNILGEEYERNIIDSLVYVRCPDMGYRWGIADGKVEVVNGTRGNMTIEYSGEACSGDVIIEKDGNRYSYEFQYSYHRRR